MTADELWWHIWTKIRYADFRAAFVTGEIERLKPFLDDYRVLTGPEWYFDPSGTAHGGVVREFLAKTGRFAEISYNKSGRKLKKILKAAEAFQAFPPDTPALVALFGDSIRRTRRRNSVAGAQSPRRTGRLYHGAPRHGGRF